MSLKLRELWNECEKMEPLIFGVFLDGLKELADSIDKRFAELSQKPCVATRGKKLKPSRKDWTEAEESTLKKCCEGVSVAKGVKAFREKTGNVRTAGACKFRVYEMKLGGRW